MKHLRKFNEDIFKWMTPNISKYKLKKVYPNSPELGTLVEMDINYDNVYTSIEGDLKFSKNEIEKFPDFWEKIRHETY